jgi:hypothetical protein
LRRQLVEIKHMTLNEVGRIRMTAQKLPPLVDIGVILTGKGFSNMSHAIFKTS